MQHQYWVTKKSVQRKLGGKEDECIVSSDAELDAKLELLRSISDSCVQLQRVINAYQERLCYLAQEENALGRYLKECSKSEKNPGAARIEEIAGKSLAYAGRQRLNVRPPLVRLHHEVDTFRGRAVADTRSTVSEMEKARTEYRAALSWMKSTSSELDPDTGHGLDRFRKAQACVRSSKARFDRLMLACLQKVDLLAAARCNMFSHALVSYQNALVSLANEASRTLKTAAEKVKDAEADSGEISGLAEGADEDGKTFLNAEYKDEVSKEEKAAEELSQNNSSGVTNLLGEGFNVDWTEEAPKSIENGSNPSSELLDLSWPMNTNLLAEDFMPSKLLQEGGLNFANLNLATSVDNKNSTEKIVKDKSDEKHENQSNKGTSNNSQVSWLSLFAELDPLANQGEAVLSATADRA